MRCAVVDVPYLKVVFLVCVGIVTVEYLFVANFQFFVRLTDGFLVTLFLPVVRVLAVGDLVCVPSACSDELTYRK